MNHGVDAIVAIVFLDVAIVVVVARLMARLFRAIRQPPVIGEILAGILLGPTLLGAFPGHLDQALFPTDARPYLTILAQLGLVLFMFIVGLELDLSYVSGRLRIASVVSLTSITLPFGLGVLLALAFADAHRNVNGHPVSTLALALFLGIAMSITAFPVLARILTDRGLHRTPTGVLSLACAAIDDVVAWSLLAIVVAVVSGGGPTRVLITVGLAAVYVAIMFLVVRPLLGRLVARYLRVGRLTPDILAVVLVGVLLSAFITDRIGVHVIFGAFLFGAAMPRNGAAAMTREILERLEQVSVLLLLPMFFVVTGLGVDVGAIGTSGLPELGLILLVAVAGKFLGAATAARSVGVPQRQALALGALMNTRGLTELVILQVGRQLGVLDDRLFTLLVVMAVLTTVMTEPLLRWIYPDRMVRRDIAAAEREALGGSDVDTVVVAFDRPDTGRAPADVGRDLVQAEGGRVVLACYLPRPSSRLEVGAGLGDELAAVATAGHQLKLVAQQLRAEEIDAHVVCRYGEDPAAELETLARELDASTVVTTTARGPAGPATVIVPEQLRNTPDGPVQVFMAEVVDADERAALRLAVRIARSRGLGVQLVVVEAEDHRRWLRRLESIAQAVRQVHLDCEIVNHLDSDPKPYIAVLPDSCSQNHHVRFGVPRPTMTVRAGEVDVDANLSETLAQLVRN